MCDEVATLESPEPLQAETAERAVTAADESYRDAVRIQDTVEAYQTLIDKDRALLETARQGLARIRDMIDHVDVAAAIGVLNSDREAFGEGVVAATERKFHDVLALQDRITDADPEWRTDIAKLVARHLDVLGHLVEAVRAMDDALVGRVGERMAGGEAAPDSETLANLVPHVDDVIARIGRAAREEHAVMRRFKAVSARRLARIERDRAAVREMFRRAMPDDG